MHIQHHLLSISPGGLALGVSPLLHVAMKDKDLPSRLGAQKGTAEMQHELKLF